MAFLQRITNLFRRRQVGAEIDAELRAHIEMRIDDNLAAGMRPAEARREALLRFGNPDVMRERVTAADTELWIAGLGRDLRYVCRQLRHSPGFALTAVLTLALGIGANVVVLSVLQSLVLHPLHLADADRLVQIVKKNQGDDNQSYPDYVDYRDRNRTFSALAADRLSKFSLRTEDGAVPLWAYEVSCNYFDMLGIRPVLGRFFHASDDRGPNSAPYIVLSSGLWQSRFHSNPHVVGTGVRLNGSPFTVIGVAPPEFHGTEVFIWPGFWMPIVNQQQLGGFSFLENRSYHNLWIVGKRKAGVTEEQATDDLNGIARQLARQYPRFDEGLTARLVKPGLMGDAFGDPARNFLLATLTLSLLVLLAACVNLAGIFSARAADRSRELAIRLAIGSTRWHVLRQLLIEAIVVSLAGGGLGTLFGITILGALSRWQPFADLPVRVTVTPDWRVFAFALLLAVGSGLLFGLLPARQVWRTDCATALKSGVDAPMLLRRLTLRDVLLGLQVALCTLLVTASLVAVRGMQRSLNAPLGFSPQGAILARTDMQMAGYKDAHVLPLQRRMLDQVAALPGVRAAGIISNPPLGTGGGSTAIYREGTTDLRPSNAVTGAMYFSITPGYLTAAGTRLLTGRDITWHDDDKSRKVALVNATFARKLFGDHPAIGRRFVISGDPLEIVGIVEDGKYNSLTEDSWAAVFFPAAQDPDSNTTLVVRTALPPEALASPIENILKNLDPNLPVTIQSWQDALSFSLFPARVAAAALSVLGGLAALLAVTGIFGMAAYSVSKRLRELGIRLALGAHRRQLLTAALKRPLVLLLSGSAAGLALGALASRLLAQIVYHATPRDPVVLLGTVAAMVALGLLATWIPARRALRIDPARLLRED